jgi:hypothetical protein
MVAPQRPGDAELEGGDPRVPLRWAAALVFIRAHRLDRGLGVGVDAPRLEQHPTAELQIPTPRRDRSTRKLRLQVTRVPHNASTVHAAKHQDQKHAIGCSQRSLQALLHREYLRCVRRCEPPDVFPQGREFCSAPDPVGQQFVLGNRVHRLTRRQRKTTDQVFSRERSENARSK